MADGQTALLQLVKQETGNNNNSWGDINNAQFDKIDAAIAGTSNIIVTGGTTVLSDDQSRPSMLIIQGALTADSIIQVPARYKQWLVLNQTTGNFVVRFQATGGGTPYIVARGAVEHLWCDGSLIRPVGESGQVPVGGIVLWPLDTMPSNYVECLGGAISRTQFAKLYSLVGTKYGGGDGTTTFNTPNVGNRYPRGRGIYNAGTYVAQDIMSHTHSGVTDFQGSHNHSATSDTTSDHVHGGVPVVPGFAAYASGGNTAGQTTSTTTTAAAGSHSHFVTVVAAGSHQHNLVVNATGGSENRPETMVFAFAMRFQ